MSKRREHRLVLDVGKTNVKIHVLNEAQATLASHTRDNVVVATGPYPHADVDGIWDWVIDVFARVARRFDIGAIAVTTHGATAALVNSRISGNGLVLPVVDYEWNGLDPDGVYARVRPVFSETLSPDLPAGLNLGRQLFWQQGTFPDEFENVDVILLYPQYWAWRMTGHPVSEVSSLGCHTDLWSPVAGDYSSLVDRCGWRALFPPLVPAWESVGTITPALRDTTGLPADCCVHAGVHDSNASLLRFILAKPDESFCVVSSGTWVICMSTERSVDELDETRDMLANVDVNNRLVPCIRFMGGREYAEICTRCGASVGDDVSPDDLATVIADQVFALPDFSGGSGPFGGRAPSIEGRVSNGNALATVYCALMVDVCLDLLGVHGDVIIVGSYLQNPLLCSLVAQLRREQPVYLSSDTAGTVRGAAQLTDWARPVSVSLTPCVPSDLPGLDRYAQSWRERADRRS